MVERKKKYLRIKKRQFYINNEVPEEKKMKNKETLQQPFHNCQVLERRGLRAPTITGGCERWEGKGEGEGVGPKVGLTGRDSGPCVLGQGKFQLGNLTPFGSIVERDFLRSEAS